MPHSARCGPLTQPSLSLRYLPPATRYPLLLPSPDAPASRWSLMWRVIDGVSLPRRPLDLVFTIGIVSSEPSGKVMRQTLRSARVKSGTK